jgi:hypothetical protein
MNDGEMIMQFFKLKKSSKGIQALRTLRKKCAKKKIKEARHAGLLCQ